MYRCRQKCNMLQLSSSAKIRQKQDIFCRKMLIICTFIARCIAVQAWYTTICYQAQHFYTKIYEGLSLWCIFADALTCCISAYRCTYACRTLNILIYCMANCWTSKQKRIKFKFNRIYFFFLIYMHLA